MPSSPPEPQTSRPMRSLGPSTTTPAKSRPGVRGQTACRMPPSNAFASLGLTPELRTSTIAEPSGMAFGRSISTRRRTASSASGPDAFASTRTAREWVELFTVSLLWTRISGGGALRQTEQFARLGGARDLRAERLYDSANLD